MIFLLDGNFPALARPRLEARGHPGIAVITLRKPNTPAILPALERVLPQLESGPQVGRSYLVTDSRMYLRSSRVP